MPMASASITKLAMVRLQKYIDDNNKDAKIVAVIHDEILIICHKDIAEEMAKAVQESMIGAFNHYCPDVEMTADAVIDNHWVH
jgi:DNA polymerase I-like protein with 3'-5' exonuclease and polymerase domains